VIPKRTASEPFDTHSWISYLELGMSYQVTARKWRPMIFEDVVGQSHVTTTLRNAIATNRVAHAYIFSGARGCGKTTTARILAKALNCSSLTNQNPCNSCEMCASITAGRSLDVIEIDGASNRGIEEIRNLRESVRFTPSQAAFKVYIIDEVHMLTKEAFNALLKTLEEPPAHVIFIFATTEVHKVPATILSRCQRFDFRRIAVNEISDRLRHIASEENVAIEEEGLLLISKKGDGSLRDAQSIFDQVRSACGNTISTADVLTTLNVLDQEIFFRVTSLISERDAKGGILLVDEIVKSGHDLREFASGLIEHLRNLLVARSTGITHLLEVSDHYRQRYDSEAQKFPESDILRLIKLATDVDNALRWSPQPRYKLETALVQMISLEGSAKIDELLLELDHLKKKLSGSAGNDSPKPKPPLQRSESQPAATATPRVSEHRNPFEVKVVGSVNAGPLRSLSAAVSSPGARLESTPSQPTGMYEPRHANAVSISQPGIEQQSTLTQLKPITLESAYSSWRDWISEVSHTKVSVGSILGSTQIVGVSNGALRIGCPDDFHISSLKRNREFLANAFLKVTGCAVRIEPILSDVKPQIAPHPPDVISENSEVEEHPVVAALKRELGAEPVE